MLTLNLLELFFNSIEYIHGSVWPDCNEIFNSADYTLADFRHGGFLLIGHAAYDEIYLPAFLEIVSYADSDSRIVLCSEEFLNILKAVVSSVAAFLSHSESAERKVQVIADHQINICSRDFFLVIAVGYMLYLTVCLRTIEVSHAVIVDTCIIPYASSGKV